MNLRDYARGKECAVRVPQICRGGTETTVLAHVRQIGISGGGLKAPDLLGSWCCHACHMAIDGQANTPFSHDQLQLMHLRGVMRTQYELIQSGKVKW